MGAILSSFESDAATFKRFWRGYQRSDLSATQFVSDVNTKIIPATRELFAKPSGLMNYQPVISNSSSQKASSSVAAEYALLEYESEAIYKEYRVTDAGKAYGDLHWELFDQTISKSAVVEAYAGKVEVTHAYDVIGQDIDWKKAATQFSIQTRLPGVSEEDFLASVVASLDEMRDTAKGWGLQAAIVLVMNDHVVIYQAWDKVSSRRFYEEAIESDMPSGENTLRDTARSTLDTQLEKTSKPLKPGQGLKMSR
jgi:hypothetical protein